MGKTPSAGSRLAIEGRESTLSGRCDEPPVEGRRLDACPVASEWTGVTGRFAQPVAKARRRVCDRGLSSGKVISFLGNELTAAQKSSTLNLGEIRERTILTADVEDSVETSRRTRRNIVGIGAIFGSVVLAKTAAFACPPALCSANCFLKGTKIETAKGERKIEDLAIGDLLPTRFGGLRPIQWIGRYSRKKSDPSKPWVKSAQPALRARSQCPACRSLRDSAS
jgi:hypothetical protein